MNDKRNRPNFGSSEEKRALLAELLRKKIQKAQSAIVPIKPRPEHIPLSFSQQRMWFLDQLIPGCIHNIPIAARLRGHLNLAALQASLTEIARHHEVIRTHFIVVGGQPMQYIAEKSVIPLVIEDVQRSPFALQEDRVMQRLIDEAQRPFNLSAEPLLRGLLLRLSADDHVLLLVMHHSISDGWSIGLLLHEIGVLYTAYSAGQPSPLPELSVQYADYTLWQRERMQGPFLEQQLAYWRKQLAGIPAALSLPTDYLRPSIQVFRGAAQAFIIPAPLAETLKSLSQRMGVTLFMTLLAAFQTLLSFSTGQEDIVIGSPIANRIRPEIEEVIGCFINTVVLRVNLAGDPTFEELLRQVRDVTLGAYAHQDMPFEMLVEELQPERDLSRNPLFQVMFVLQNAPRSTLQLGDIAVERIAIDTKTTGFDLTLFITETEQGLRGDMNYSTDLFAPATIQRMIGHYLTLLSALPAYPDWRISELPILTAAEKVQFSRWNKTDHSYSRACRLHELFEAQVEQTPQRPALICGEQHWTYQEMNRKANQLARYLLKRGVTAGTRVGLYMERSPLAIVGILAVLKAGGVYIPLDPVYPCERIAFMLEDAQASFLITQEKLASTLTHPTWEAICLDRDWENVVCEGDTNLSCTGNAHDLAYIIYTSGSTGRPKGVAVYQYSLLNLLNWYIYEFDITKDDNVLLMTSLSFDLTQKNIFAPLFVGGQLYLLDSEPYDAHIITQTLSQAAITLLNCTPSAFYPLVLDSSEENLSNLRSLRYLFLGGEPISADRLQKWGESPQFHTKIVNTYGPTECTDIATFYRLRDLKQLQGASVPLGMPIDNVRLYVLDTSLRRLPVGVVGELYIAGEGVGPGYINDALLTSARFVPDPFGEGAGKRMYRTGDLARYLPDGNLEFFGRTDTQVKLRGFRIELAEIEAVIARHPTIKECLVLIREESQGEKRLVAYVVLAQQRDFPLESIRSYLKERLPDYMIPALFLSLEALPLSPNGKIDYNSLPALKQDTVFPQQKQLAARTDLERMLTEMWCEILNLEQIGIDENFFEVGGHSLLAVSLLAKLAERTGKVRSVKLLFLHPTIASLAEALSAENAN